MTFVDFEKVHDDIKVIANGDISLQQLIEDTKSTFLTAWQDRKVQLTKQAKQHLLKQLKDDIKAQIVLLNSIDSLAKAKTLIQGLEDGMVSDFIRKADALFDDDIQGSAE